VTRHGHKYLRDILLSEHSTFNKVNNSKRKALIVGIDHYTSASNLYGCVSDAKALGAILERHGHADASINFAVKLLTTISTNNIVSKSELKDNIEHLFDTDCEIALFYFAGHGHLEISGGYLWTSDTRRGDDGLSLDTILRHANRSRARHKVILLDSCHSGIAASTSHSPQIAEIADGVTILTASTANQYSAETHGSGLFTSLLIDALNGSAANLLGEISPGAVYAHIDKSLGAWARQRPVFKTNVSCFISLRNVQPSIRLNDLQQIVELFPVPGYHFPLDPSFEPETAGRRRGVVPPDRLNTLKFAILQRYNRVNLLVPVDASHMWHAAMESKACKLTVLGEHYRRLVEQKLL
jgi:hypothetical protein